MKELFINDQIRDREVRLVDENGQLVGVIPIAQAREIAKGKDLDLVKVTPPGTIPATCKLMDYGKYCYDQQKKEKENKKNQTITEIKEIRLSATIDVADANRLAAQSAKFIEKGNKVKASIRLKGRQQAHPEIAKKIIEDYIESVREKSVSVALTVEKPPTQEGRNIYVVLAPSTKK